MKSLKLFEILSGKSGGKLIDTLMRQRCQVGPNSENYSLGGYLLFHIDKTFALYIEFLLFSLCRVVDCHCH